MNYNINLQLNFYVVIIINETIITGNQQPRYDKSLWNEGHDSSLCYYLNLCDVNWYLEYADRMHSHHLNCYKRLISFQKRLSQQLVELFHLGRKMVGAERLREKGQRPSPWHLLGMKWTLPPSSRYCCLWWWNKYYNSRRENCRKRIPKENRSVLLSLFKHIRYLKWWTYILPTNRK